MLRRYKHGNQHVLHRLANLHPLRSAGTRVRHQLAPFGPGIRGIVVINVAQQQTALRFMHDQAQIAADPHRPKVLIFGTVELMKAHTATGGLHLQIKRGGLAGLLLVASQAR